MGTSKESLKDVAYLKVALLHRGLWCLHVPSLVLTSSNSLSKEADELLQNIKFIYIKYFYT